MRMERTGACEIYDKYHTYSVLLGAIIWRREDGSYPREREPNFSPSRTVDEGNLLAQ